MLPNLSTQSWRVIAILGLSAITVLGGCGGSSGSSMTKAQFVKQGNAICVKGEEQRFKNAEAQANAMPPAQLSTVGAQEKLLLVGMSAYEGTAEKLGSLPSPDGSEDQVEKIVAAMEEAAIKVREVPSTALVSNYPFREADELLEGYGLKKCLA